MSEIRQSVQKTMGKPFFCTLGHVVDLLVQEKQRTIPVGAVNQAVVFDAVVLVKQVTVFTAFRAFIIIAVFVNISHCIDDRERLIKGGQVFVVLCQRKAGSLEKQCR